MKYEEFEKALSQSRTLPANERGQVLASLMAQLGISPAQVEDFRDAAEKVKSAIRYHCAKERGLLGQTHLMKGGEVVEVHPIRADGYIQIKGVRGSFHPLGFDPVL